MGDDFDVLWKQFSSELWDLRHGFEAAPLVKLTALLPRLVGEGEVLPLEGRPAEMLAAFFDQVALQGPPGAPMQEAILGFARQLHRVELPPDELQVVLGTVLGFAIRHGDAEAIECCLGQVPETVTQARLAFNLCCLAALRGQDAEVLRWIPVCLQLGQTADDFRRDRDFAGYVGRPEFEAALEAR